MFSFRRCTLAMATTAALAGGWAGLAADTRAQSAPPAQAAPTASVNEEDIRAYAEAALAVQEISAKWQPRIAAAQEQQRADEIAGMQRDAQQEMVEAVQDKGLTVERYNDIYKVAQADPAVRDRIVQHMESAR